MRSLDWKNIAELIGIGAIVASLVFVGLQMRQAQDIALSDRGQTQVANQMELLNAINEHPEIWAKGLAGDHLDENDGIVFENLMLARDAYAYFSATAALELGYESGASYYVTSYAAFLHRNPGARQWYEDHVVADEEIVRLSRGSVVLGDWPDQIKAVWAEIERIDDQGSRRD